MTAVTEELHEVKKNGNKWRSGALACLYEAAFYVGAFLIALILFLWLKPEVNKWSTISVGQVFAISCIVVCGIVGVWLGVNKQLTTYRAILLLLIAGFALRVGYMLYTPVSVRQQDTYSSVSGAGHEAYAWTIFDTGKLPTKNTYQFYHPPFNALMQAGFMKFTAWLSETLLGMSVLKEGFETKYAYGMPSYLNDANRYFLYSTTQILSVMYSLITCVVLLKIIKSFHFSDETRLLLAAFVIFFPRHIQFAGMVNNDALSYMLGMMALLFTLRWWKGGKNFVWIMLCGLCVGLGMMTKLASATVCLPIAGVFIYEFVKTLQKKKGSLPFVQIFCQYALFLCICAPIGLWFQVYANVKFDQPFGYVYDNLNKRLSTSHYSLFERFIFPFDMSEFFGSLWCVPFFTANKGINVHKDIITKAVIAKPNNHYLFHYSVRSSIFGEFSYEQGGVIGAIAVVMEYLAILALGVALVWCLVLYIKGKRGKNNLLTEKKPVSFKDLLFVFLLMQSQVVPYVYFYLSMPYACTMDFRYIMPIILAIALTIGMAQKTLISYGGKKEAVVSRCLTVTCALFLVCSTVFYCVCM